MKEQEGAFNQEKALVGAFSMITNLRMELLKHKSHYHIALHGPPQVIFKCCKLVPVLIGGILIQGKRYGLLDFAASGFMCCGLILFTLADSKVMCLLSTFVQPTSSSMDRVTT